MPKINCCEPFVIQLNKQDRDRIKPFINCYTNVITLTCWALVVDQLVERSLPTPEVRSLNPFVANFYIEHLLTVNYIEKTKINEKEAGSGPFIKKTLTCILSCFDALKLPLTSLPRLTCAAAADACIYTEIEIFLFFRTAHFCPSHMCQTQLV